jgi:ribosomal protein S27E
MEIKCPNCSNEEVNKKRAKDFILLLEGIVVAVVGFFLLPAWYGILVLVVGVLGGLLGLFSYFSSETQFECQNCGHTWLAPTKEEVSGEQERSAAEVREVVKNSGQGETNEKGKISIKLANEELGPVFKEFKQQTVTSYEQAAEICSKYNIDLERLKYNYEYKENQALGVISGWLMEDSVILFNDFFICYTTAPYLAQYEELEQDAGWLNKNRFKGESEYLDLSSEEKSEIKEVIEDTEAVS